ncbi:MAG: hypothetical protein HY951_13085, partial [Bacteroidia bacterium]|nr:hypothetical protein [Bacteroidia bacterium]
PTAEENIPYMVSFGGQSETKWGDDDFCEIFFLVIPTSQLKPVYLRVYDPDCGGELDEAKGAFDTKTSFSVYGGKSCISEPDAKGTEPKGNFKSGNLLATKTFAENAKYDKNWYTFGPFNPTEGELSNDYGGYVFKIIAQGVSGDDGNLYRYFLSTQPDENIAVEGSNAFTFEYTFRMHDNVNNVSHIYPYVDKDVVSVKIFNFDWDNDGVIRIVSVAKNGSPAKVSAEGNWETSLHTIVAEEKNTSLDIQFVKNRSAAIKNNNVVIYVTNQRGDQLPFFTAPIGGIPKFKGKIIATQIEKKKK